MQIKWREEAFVLIVLVSMLVYLPVLLDDVAPSTTAISWFILGWIAVRTSALVVQSRHRRDPGAPR